MFNIKKKKSFLFTTCLKTLFRRGYTDLKRFNIAHVKCHYDEKVKDKSNVPTNLENTFRIVLPPPNVTGNLHIGHALTVAIEDAFCRHQLYLGKNVLWYPGFDHAGISTQNVVEKQLLKKTGKMRKDLIRLKFVEYCEKWKDERINDIIAQLNSIGCNLDWSNMFYTMDKNFSRAVRIAFCKLYQENLIYRDKKLVNWCPILESTVSDQEVEIVDGKKICTRTESQILEIEKEQWFLRCNEMNHEVIKALNNGEIKIKPKCVESQLHEWLKYSEPWCLSRQLLWGHQIPAYLDKSSNRWIVAENKDLARKEINKDLIQDPDVLDTWFSSALIPLIIAGWPDKKINGRVLDVMETGHDIIGFWVARMLTVGKKLTNYFPFDNVVLHGLIRDSQGRKMSKSLGNVIDPLDVINGTTLDQMLTKLNDSNLSLNELEKSQIEIKKKFPTGIKAYGADALRFAFFRHNLNALDVNFSLKEVDEGFKFCNKLWNMIKYGEIVFDAAKLNKELILHSLRKEDISILSELNVVISKYFKHMEEFNPHLAFAVVYKFTLNDVCDVYLETTKKILRSGDKTQIFMISKILKEVLEKSLKMLTPFMPYVSTYLLDNCENLKQDFQISEIEFANNTIKPEQKMKKMEK